MHKKDLEQCGLFEFHGILDLAKRKLVALTFANQSYNT